MIYQKIQLNLKIAFCVIVLAQNLFANCGVGNFGDVNEVNADLKEECENLLGGLWMI